LEAKIIFLKSQLLAILLSLRLGELMKEEIFNLENLLEISTKMLLQLERYVSQKLKKLSQLEPLSQIRYIWPRFTLIESSRQKTLLRE
jgi:ribosomal protein S13